MAVQWISANWKTELKTPSMAKKERFYIDPRQLQYPPLNDDTAFTLITDADNQPGKFNLTSGHCDYALPLDGVTELTVIARVKPQFDYDVAADQPLWAWYIDNTHNLTLTYSAATDKYHVEWQDGGNLRYLFQPDAYTDNPSLQVWMDIAFSFNFTTEAGAFYIDRVLMDGTWNDAIDSKTSYFPLFSLRHENGTEGDYYINYLRILTNDAATSTEIANDLKTIQTEEIFWSLDGHGLGRSRCNITDFVTRFTLEKSREDRASGAPGANSLMVDLQSTSGEFADDQYDTFSPPTVYNGTAAQKYLQKRCPLSLEHWYDHLFEPIFVGRVDENLFTRFTSIDDLSKVTISGEDMASDIAREEKRKARYWEDKKLSDATEADSLVHLIARLATQRTIYNFTSNSSFENATIGNSWYTTGAGAAFNRVAGGLFGDWQGDLIHGGAICSLRQMVTFTGTKKLNVGETWNFSIWLKSANAVSNGSTDLFLSEQDAGGENHSSVVDIALTAGADWKLFEVSHTITDSDSDRLCCIVRLADAVTLSCDGAMLVQNDRAFKWFVLNNNDGAAGVESADDADYAAFDMCGFDADAVNIVHPWAVVEQGESIWEYLKEIAVGTVASYMGFDSSGTLKFRSRFKTGYVDPTPIETITSFVGINTMLAPIIANKIEICGVKITKNTNYEIIWTNRDSAAWDQNLFYLILSDGDTYPDIAIFGNFWAKYKDGLTLTVKDTGQFG